MHRFNMGAAAPGEIPGEIEDKQREDGVMTSVTGANSSFLLLSVSLRVIKKNR